ncbi:MAG: Gar1/Naf1 family protein [Nitrososphaeraceae archaeon]|jgi:rRNA processing protein Gar1|nr:Gar1/Naf1 family protein [Nitrososphaeraceae archaeon]MDW0135401.1 Gar1/Naf1 family protein [Nitrososphaeraceae archaeon]MDW0155162.1 Gar1/Naf1 family protein [Nitrososphaeraceae archaeon]
MEMIGEIIHMAKSGRLIVKVEENTNHNLIGQALIDNNGSRIGKIIELIGSVKSPYASVMPALNSKYTVGGKVYRAPNLHQFSSSRKRNRTKRRKMA